MPTHAECNMAESSGGFGDIDALQNSTTGRELHPHCVGECQALGAWQVDLQILQMLQGFISVFCAMGRCSAIISSWGHWDSSEI